MKAVISRDRFKQVKPIDRGIQDKLKPKRMYQPILTLFGIGSLSDKLKTSD